MAKSMYLRSVVVVVMLCGISFAADTNMPIEKQEILRLNPNLKFPTLARYEAEIKKPGLILDSNCICLFAPKEKAQEAKIVFKYLVQAYKELYRIIGRHTEYKIVVYHFPEANPNFSGGTSNCTLWYGVKNLDLASSEEWKKFHIPHVSGYIEEMAHNFVSGTHAQFGWEMVGWSVGVKVTSKVAANPLLKNAIHATRQGQAQTFNHYVQGGYVFPGDLPPNQCDRIHAYILWQCEQKYGPDFWPNFFKEIAKEQESLATAAVISDSDRNRNERYQITVECFNRLHGLNFKEMLKKNQISLNTDLKSLHPTDSGWNRKFVPSRESPSTTSSVIIDSEKLPPLHRAAYMGDGAKVKQLLAEGADVCSKNCYGLTALHLAAMNGHQATAEALLNGGADINARDEQRQTAADLAKKKGNEGTAKFLSEKESQASKTLKESNFIIN
ncbi:MAG: hypothetical protein A2Y07_09020 [Planctomycetes bacterium GWF2_50_10]|nr:MAG: hypothetical protein A2Y07_09020 [Planctomycetes bacterium GWF2_50_10]